MTKDTAKGLEPGGSKPIDGDWKPVERFLSPTESAAFIEMPIQEFLAAREGLAHIKGRHKTRRYREGDLKEFQIKMQELGILPLE